MYIKPFDKIVNYKINNLTKHLTGYKIADRIDFRDKKLNASKINYIIKKRGERMSVKEFRGKYYFLSNFYEAPVTHNEVTYQNNEAAFQAMKCIHIEQRKNFSHLNPSQAKSKGRRVQLRHDWEKIKDQVMYEVVKAKFEQNEDLKAKLLDTENKHLEEGNTWGDRIWGTVNGVGQNRLGKILMRVREELR